MDVRHPHHPHQVGAYVGPEDLGRLTCGPVVDRGPVLELDRPRRVTVSYSDLRVACLRVRPPQEQGPRPVGPRTPVGVVSTTEPLVPHPVVTDRCLFNRVEGGGGGGVRVHHPPCSLDDITVLSSVRRVETLPGRRGLQTETFSVSSLSPEVGVPLTGSTSWPGTTVFRAPDPIDVVSVVPDGVLEPVSKTYTPV